MIPFLISDEEIDQEVAPTEKPSSKTYKLDFETGEILPEFIDYEEAIKQAVVKAIRTRRSSYLIYSDDYGSEIGDLLGEAYSIDYLQIEVPRLISETFLDDDRILECTDFEITKTGESIYCSFTVVTDIQTAVQVEVEI